ncbi:amidohydrolase family protein [Plectonema radiosum NIES-515]|uniref:Amidohydrolase family protein n=1 Tax=Plectonema radiosum NIES-515 TaxID=2986073 RepID=A0ABT3AWI7_9CYAN|nr:amidohydrolase family protein [Plectonema radiosum]MCV3213488.1 amidohydrolase family protein [Plectonema radiosum NIES-515]
MRFFYRVILGALMLALMGMGLTPQVAHAQIKGCPVPLIGNLEPPPPPPDGVLFQNVRIFNGLTDGLSGKSDVLVIENKINKISLTSIDLTKLPEIELENGNKLDPKNVETINGNGLVMMPGLIDNHVHIYMSANPQEGKNGLLNLDTNPQILESKAQAEAKNILLRGFTAVRDMGGPVFPLKQLIDLECTPGPRIYPSGATISQTSGHGDFGDYYARPRRFGGKLSRAEDLRATIIADGRDEVLTATRENLRLGASQIKLMAGGGAASLYDPLDVAEYTLDEIKAAVEAADDWGTYVTVHAYTPKAVRRAITAGVKCIEHGQLLDEETMQLLAKKGIWLSLQTLEPAPGDTEPLVIEKKRQVIDGTDKAFTWAKKYNVNLAWGTDFIFNPGSTYKQNSFIPKLKTWLSNFEALKLVTHDNAQLLALSGPRNPYPGELGVIKEGAYADLLLVKGNPLDDLSVLGNDEDNKNNFQVIMKDGNIYKNCLSQPMTNGCVVPLPLIP